MSAKQAELAARCGIAASYSADETYLPGKLFPKTPAWVIIAVATD